jgi:hypothetical protein
MLLGFFMLAVRMMVRRLQVMVGGGVMVCSRKMVMLDGRVLRLLSHTLLR